MQARVASNCGSRADGQPSAGSDAVAALGARGYSPSMQCTPTLSPI
ncbi:MAG: hypothetical protein NZ765_07965 [Anaerolineae bacterium]|nr:hypothetical protein [Anaerolineae bacterium]MDW8070944.1 hypothetical protein [Anaerolineae bacterium]